MSAMLELGILAVSLFFLTKSADYFTESAEKLGKMIGLSQFFTGIVIVAIGTSIPEIATSIAAVWDSHSEIVAGNILGTVIANTLLGFGIGAIAIKGGLRPHQKHFEVDFSAMIVSVILLFFALADGVFSSAEAVMSLLGFAVYMIYAYTSYKNEKAKNKSLDLDWTTPAIALVSLGVVFVSSDWVINSVIRLSEMLGISTTVLAASVVATGTSLPEMAVTLVAAKRRNFDLIIGNLMGSNIFVLFVIFGVTGLMTNLVIEPIIVSFVLPFILATLALFWVAGHDLQIRRTEGLLMLLLFAFYNGKLYGLV